MPAEPPRPCQQSGCRAFALPRNPRCALHCYHYDRNVRANTPELRRAAQIRGSSAWKKTRALVATAEPLCCDPFSVHTFGPEPGQDVHHVLPLASHPHLALDTANLRSLCRNCHNRVESMERSGQTTQHLFYGTTTTTD